MLIVGGEGLRIAQSMTIFGNSVENGNAAKALENKKKLILGCLKTVHEIARYTIRIEQERGEPYEKMMQRKNELKAQA